MNINYDTCTKDEVIASHKELHASYKKLAESHQEQVWKIQQLNHRLNELERMIFGRKSERFVSELPSAQLQMAFSPETETPDRATQKDKEEISYTRKKPEYNQHPVRQELPAHLAREIVELYPEGHETGVEIGAPEVTEVLEYKPGKLHVIQYRRHKYKIIDHAGREKIVMPNLISRGIDKGLPGPGLISHTITDKYVDHTPLYRQSQQWSREQVDLSRSTMNGWIGQVYTLLLALLEVHEKVLMQCDYLQVDESSIRVLTKSGDKKAIKGCMQVYHAVQKKMVWFRYTRTKEQANLIDILKEFKGNVQVDGNVSYDELKKVENQKKVYPDITISHCMAHARRKFDQALDNDKARASHVLTEIRKLYDIERQIKQSKLDKSAIEMFRQEHSVPILNALKQWLDKEYKQVLPQSIIAKGMAYTVRRWKGLCEYVNNGHLLIDNNLVENQIRPLALGRKNYMFAATHNGARWAAMFYSFFGTCKLNGIDAFWWLRDVLIRIQDHPVNRLHELLPTKDYQFLHPKEAT